MISVILPQLEPGAKFVGYGRVSTDDQNEAMQRDELIGLGIPENNIYVDKSSGRTLKRRGFQGALKALRAGDVLVIWHLDRMTRSLADFEGIVAEFRERGVSIFAVMHRIDLTTPAGRLFARIQMAFAEYEVEMTSARTKAGQEAGRARGFNPGRPSKLGSAEKAVLLAELAKVPAGMSIKAWRYKVAAKWNLHEATVRNYVKVARRKQTRDRRSRA